MADYVSLADYRRLTMESGSSFDGCQNLEDYADIEKWLANCRLFEDPQTVPPGYSLGFQYAYVDGNEVIGMVNIRPLALQHVFLKQYGGHIGYSIRPDRRKQGIGTKMLRDTLILCRKEYGLDRVLVTCLEDNEASAKVIMNNGGVYENKVYYAPEEKYIRRFWIEL